MQEQKPNEIISKKMNIVRKVAVAPTPRFQLAHIFLQKFSIF